MTAGKPVPQPLVELSGLDVATAGELLRRAFPDGAALTVAHPDPAQLRRLAGEALALRFASPDAAGAGPLLHLAGAGPDEVWLLRTWQRAAAGVDASPLLTASPAPSVRGLRVLLICHEATRTGAPIALLGIARWLAAHGAILTTLVLVDGPLREHFAELGPVLRASGQLALSELPAVDVVYANTVVPSLIVAQLAEHGATAILHAHELDHAIASVGVDHVRRGLIASRHLLAVSEASEMALRRALGAIDRPITRISEPLPEDRFSVAAELGAHRHGSEPGFVVGGFGTFCRLKGGDLFATVAAMAPGDGEPPWTFQWVGQRGDDASALLGQVRAAGHPDRMTFAGELDRPLELVQRFAVLALLSRQDSYPLAMLEAALVGVPTLAQRGSGGPEEFARDGGAAIVEAEDPAAVLRGLRLLQANPALRRLLADAGRTSVLRRNTLDAIAPVVGRVLVEVARPAPVQVRSSPPPAPTVSIVIPVFNRADMTERCLRALAPTVEGVAVELVVVDNGSSDGSAELVERLWPGATIVRNAANQGFARGCNQGVAAARAERIVILNNDTEPRPGWLEALLGHLEDPSVGLVAPKLLFPEGTLQHGGMWLVEDRKLGLPLNAVHRYYREPADTAAVNEVCDLQLVTGAVLAVRRSVFAEVGGFDEGYWNGCEDVELCLAVGAVGYGVRYEPASVLVHHESASGAERWTKLNENLRRLTERWAARARPDVIIAADGSVVPTGGTFPLPAAPGGLRVALEGAAFQFHSLAQVNRELAVRLAAEHGFAIAARSTGVPEVTPADDARLLPVAAASAATPPLRPQVTIRHQWPPDWSDPADDSPLVIVQPWEFGGLPDEWLEPLHRLPDEIWCYTTWVRDCYLRSGVPAERLVVLPIGVDPQRFHPDGDRLPLRTTRGTRLLFVGGLLHRKGVDHLLEAYCQAFTADDDVCLVVKAFGGDSVYRHASGAALLREVMSRPGAPEIELITRDLDQAEMAALYRSCDVLVHPYRGEGFGMPIAEAMASGLAVVVTDDGAARDFCDAETSLLVPSRRVATTPAANSLPPSRAGYWYAEVDRDALAASLQTIVADVPRRTALAEAGRRRVLEQLDWTAITAVAAERLRALAARPARRLGADAATAGTGRTEQTNWYVPDGPGYELDETRPNTVLVVAGGGHDGWPRALAAVVSAVRRRDDVTVVVAVDDEDAAARERTLELLGVALDAAERDGAALDVLAVLEHEDRGLAALMRRCRITVAVDAEVARRARRCGRVAIAADGDAIGAWAERTTTAA
ncbi:MAG: glycosyltransferase [Acidimicrobiales bacterium]|nr:glycosyltransferase [Acidimicrobiales bacterium]